MKRSIPRLIAGATILASLLTLFQNCGPAKVSSDTLEQSSSSEDLGSSGPVPSPSPIATPIAGVSPTPTPTPAPSGPSLSISKTTLDFGNVDFLENSAVQSFTITNTGSVALSLNRTVIGQDYAFANGNLANICTSTLAVGQSCNIGVRFSPFDFGNSTGMVRVTSNAPNSPHLVQLTGTSNF